MYDLMEYSNNYSKASRSLWQYYGEEPSDNVENTKLFQLKVKITGKTPDANNKNNNEITVPLNYSSNFWRTLEMTLINNEVDLILTRSENYVISSATGKAKFKITDTKLYVPFVTLLTQDNANFLSN